MDLWWKIPGEIRNEIYRYLIESREIAMMRTNSTVREEMRGMVTTMIPWRLSLGEAHNKDGAHDFRLGKMKDGVRDLEIRWNLPDPCNGSEPLEGGVAERLDELELGGRRRRGCCVILIERGSYKATWFQVNDVEALAKLDVFEEVTIRIRMGETVCPARLSSHKIELVAVELRAWLETAWGQCQCRQGGGGKELSLCFRPGGDGRIDKRTEGKGDVVGQPGWNRLICL